MDENTKVQDTSEVSDLLNMVMDLTLMDIVSGGSNSIHQRGDSFKCKNHHLFWNHLMLTLRDFYVDFSGRVNGGSGSSRAEAS